MNISKKYNFAGKKITLKDIHNLAAKFKGASDMAALLEVLKNCDG